jgi:hypothetical protein
MTCTCAAIPAPAGCGKEAWIPFTPQLWAAEGVLVGADHVGEAQLRTPHLKSFLGEVVGPILQQGLCR